MKDITITKITMFLLVDTILPVLFFAGGFYSLWFNPSYIANPIELGWLLIILGFICKILYYIFIWFMEEK